jgi:antitoxin component HigA of HigAB toxin-antitoxin module
MSLLTRWGLDEAQREERRQRAYDVAYAESRVTTEAASAISYYMEQAGVTHEELARRLGVHPGRVASILMNPEVMTLRTLARVAVALGATVEVALVADTEEGS